ncbi:MAG: sigma-70 family RNA polymerase sigma factor [Gemmataceae bacterium]|nr:sigma-70 family RNA polymerase sigma factor [Gemmataceae bacterium]
MADSSLNTLMLQNCLDRWQAGDKEAANELLKIAGARLEKLARRMCRSFPNVRDWAETGDVLQNSLIRLLRTLQNMRPATTRDFFNLAAVHIRRELLDLARHYRGKGWVRLDGPARPDPHRTPHPRTEPAVPHADDYDLWTRFHEAVDRLPTEEREVVGLVFYHGWTQTRIAELFGVDERTIRRRWAAACQHVRDLVGGLPG